MSNSEQSMQIYGIISQIEQMVEESPRPKLGGGNKRVVDMDAILDVLGDLKVTIPEDLRRANSLIVDSETILDNARENAAELVENAGKEADSIIRSASEQAERILREADEEFERRVSEHEITLEAERRAQLLEKKAEANAVFVYDSAKQYADEVLEDVQKFLDNYQRLISANRRELGASQRPVQSASDQGPVITQQSYIRTAQQSQSQADFIRTAPVRPVTADEEENVQVDEERKPKQSWWSRFKGEREEGFEEEFEEEEAGDMVPDKRIKKQKGRWNRELDVDLDEK